MKWINPVCCCRNWRRAWNRWLSRGSFWFFEVIRIVSTLNSCYSRSIKITLSCLVFPVLNYKINFKFSKLKLRLFEKMRYSHLNLFFKSPYQNKNKREPNQPIDSRIALVWMCACVSEESEREQREQETRRERMSASKQRARKCFVFQKQFSDVSFQSFLAVDNFFFFF